MSLGIVIVITIGVVVIVALIFGRPFSFSYKGMKASVEQTVRVAQETQKHVEAIKEAVGAVKDAVGEANGDGPVTDMGAKALKELEAIRKEQKEVRARLDEAEQSIDARTKVTRLGRTDPEPLAVYTQERMHDILSAVGALTLKVDTLWRFLQDDYALPTLSTLTAENPARRQREQTIPD